MKSFITFLTVCLLTISSKAQTLKDFNFMLGNWEMKTVKGKISEHWQAKQDSLVGKSYSYKDLDSSKTLTESVVIKKVKGVWSFCVTGYEKGNEGTTIFKLISFKGDSLVFENKQHDFPQQISYSNLEEGYLNACIRGNINGEHKQVNFRYRRIYIGAPKGKYNY